MGSKEILVLTGSPRINGNSDLLADAFIAGAEKAGHSVTKIRTASHKINGCLGCDKCWSNGTHCVQKDDMVKLYPALEKASVLVLATPLYYYSWSAQIKCALDRTYTYVSPDRQAAMAIKETVLLAAAGTTDITDLDGLVGSYRI
ncbi:MAG: flavodoxin family protein, partial [Chitinophagales bacterium]